jgi:ABC-type dipeptide/oligopeptide/nickel transport system permease component
MQAIFLLITIAVLAATLLVDFVIVFFDPRVRTREATR